MPPPPIEVSQWNALLRSAAGYHAFRRVHTSDLTPARVAGFLLFNPSFPRSVASVRARDRPSARRAELAIWGAARQRGRRGARRAARGARKPLDRGDPGRRAARISSIFCSALLIDLTTACQRRFSRSPQSPSGRRTALRRRRSPPPAQILRSSVCLISAAHVVPQGPMQLLTVRHVTTYRYRQPVSFGEHRMMLRPRDSYDQRLLEARLVITPRAGRAALGPRRVRQLRRARALRRAGAGAALRQHDPPRSFRRPTPSISSSRSTRATTRSPTAPRSSPTCCARSSGNISIPSARSTAGRASSCAATARPARASCWRR